MTWPALVFTPGYLVTMYKEDGGHVDAESLLPACRVSISLTIAIHQTVGAPLQQDCVPGLIKDIIDVGTKRSLTMNNA